MRYIEAPDEYTGEETSLFIGGGITDCPDWQQEIVKGLIDLPLTLLNPRRKNFPINDPSATLDQIKWEFRHLRKSTAISFYFPKESLCPIVLYELGAWSMTDKILFVGTHPQYQRKEDVIIQTSLIRPEIEVVLSLESLIFQIQYWAKNKVS